MGSYVFVAIFDGFEMVDTARFLTGSYTTMDDLTDDVVRYCTDARVELIVMADAHRAVPEERDDEDGEQEEEGTDEAEDGTPP